LQKFAAIFFGFGAKNHFFGKIGDSPITLDMDGPGHPWLGMRLATR